MDEVMECETCGKTVHETPIIEKPIRVAFLSQIAILNQDTGSHRTQENICLQCLGDDIIKVTAEHRIKITIQ
jgi:hypothetical protein